MTMPFASPVGRRIAGTTQRTPRARFIHRSLSSTRARVLGATNGTAGSSSSRALEHFELELVGSSATRPSPSPSQSHPTALSINGRGTRRVSTSRGDHRVHSGPRTAGPTSVPLGDERPHHQNFPNCHIVSPRQRGWYVYRASFFMVPGFFFSLPGRGRRGVGCAPRSSRPDERTLSRPTPLAAQPRAPTRHRASLSHRTLMRMPDSRSHAVVSRAQARA